MNITKGEMQKQVPGPPIELEAYLGTGCLAEFEREWEDDDWQYSSPGNYWGGEGTYTLTHIITVKRQMGEWVATFKRSASKKGSSPDDVELVDSHWSVDTPALQLERAKREDHIAKVEAIRSVQGTCVFCGKRLAWLTRLLGKTKHRNCYYFRDDEVA